jgi:hypothetical protein
LGRVVCNIYKATTRYKARITVEIGYLRCLSQEKMKKILNEIISSQQEIGKVAVVAGDLSLVDDLPVGDSSPVDDLPEGDSSPVDDLPVDLPGTPEAVSLHPPGCGVVEINDGMVSTYYNIVRWNLSTLVHQVMFWEV